MTKKKDPSELKKRGKPEEIVDNTVLSELLKDVKFMNQLSGKARIVIADAIRNSIDKTSLKGYSPKKIILGIVKTQTVISKETVANAINGNDLFKRFSFSVKSVGIYKRITLSVIKALTECLNSGIPILKEEPDASDYLEVEEATELRNKINKGNTRYEMMDSLLDNAPDEDAILYLQAKLEQYKNKLGDVFE